VASGAGLSYQWRRDGTNLSNGGPISGANTATLTLNPVALSDAATSADGYDVVISGTCSPPVTSTRVALTVTVPKNLTWAGDGSANLWDTTSANWTGDAAIFANGDNVTFNNSGSTAPPVDLVGVVSPNNITVNASVDYTIGTTTSGSIGGSGGLTKSGSGKLTLATVNSFTGKTTVNGGTVSVATASHLGAAPPVFTADHLTLNGGTIEYTVTGSINANRGTTLGASGGTFSIPAGVTFTNTPVTTGPGSLTKTGDGTLALNVANTYAGGTVLSNGTLLFNNVNSLGTGPLTLAGGTLAPIGSLDAVTNDIVLAADSVITGGNIAPRFNGALGGSAGTLTFNGTAATFAPRVQGAFSFNRPIDLANANTSMRCYNIGTTQVFNGVISGPGTVHRRTATGGLQGTSIFNAANTFSGGFTLTEGYVGLGSSTTGDPITSGPLGTGTLTLGDSGNSALSVRGLFAAGGPRSLGNPIVFSTAALVQTNVFTGSHGLTFTGPVTLNTNRLFVVDNTGVTTFAGPIGNGAASSGLTKQGPGVLRLNGTNTYTGDTVVDAGTLSGTGILAGDVVVNSGGNLAPGAATRGTLTVNGDITLGGNFTARVSAGGSPANDQLAGATSITYGGTLTIVNEGPALNASHTFKLFDATAYSGSFASISPATPGPGLAWNTGTLTTDGTLRISAAGGPDPTPTNIVSSVSGTTLTLSWPASHTGWTLQTQTNPLSTGLITTGAWFAVPGSTSTNQVQFTIDKSNPAVFFRLYLP
jgi:autotransporter-associated beta strand protein